MSGPPWFKLKTTGFGQTLLIYQCVPKSAASFEKLSDGLDKVGEAQHRPTSASVFLLDQGLAPGHHIAAWRIDNSDDASHKAAEEISVTPSKKPFINKEPARLMTPMNSCLGIATATTPLDAVRLFRMRGVEARMSGTGWTRRQLFESHNCVQCTGKLATRLTRAAAARALLDIIVAVGAPSRLALALITVVETTKEAVAHQVLATQRSSAAHARLGSVRKASFVPFGTTNTHQLLFSPTFFGGDVS